WRAARSTSVTCPPTRSTAIRSTTSPTGRPARRPSYRSRPAATSALRSRRPPRTPRRSPPPRAGRREPPGRAAGRRPARSRRSSPDAACAAVPTRPGNRSPRTHRAGGTRSAVRRTRVDGRPSHDHAAPLAGLPAALLDELLEALQVALGLPLHEAELVVDLLVEAVGMALH